MDTVKMKNMLILKNLPSNIVEEAIVVLKPNVKFKSLDLTLNKKNTKNDNNQNVGNDKKYIINEAEMIVKDYICNIENKKESILKLNKKMEVKYKRLKMLSIFLILILIVSYFIR